MPEPENVDCFAHQGDTEKDNLSSQMPVANSNCSGENLFLKKLLSSLSDRVSEQIETLPC